MIVTNSGFEAAAAAPAYGELVLAELQCRDGTARFTTWPVDVPVFNEVWRGLGRLGQVGELHESEDGGAEKQTLTLSPVDTSILALALGDPGNYQDRPIRIWVGLLDARSFQLSGAPVLRFSGVMDQVKVDRKDTSGSISLDCRSASYDVRSNPDSLRYSDAQHRAVYPAERGFEYLPSLIGNPAVWLSKRFQQQ